jgi:hypothetical protein
LMRRGDLTLCYRAKTNLGKEEVHRLKPFSATLLVTNPIWQSLVSSQKRVLHGQG